MSSKENKITLAEWNGVSDSLISGIKGSLYKMVGIDSRSQPGTITCQQALAKDSGDTITELCKVAINISDGSKLFFSSTSGKIWRLSSGVYSLVYTVAASSGASACLGAIEYNAYVYWGTQSRLHRVQVSDLAAFASVSANWNNFSVGEITYHPMRVQNGSLWIGDATQIAKVDSSGTFTGTGLMTSVVAPYIISTLLDFDIDLLIGTVVASTVSRCNILRWDTIQTVAQYMEPVDENGIYALFRVGSDVVAVAGTSGRLYKYNGQFLVKYRRIPGTWTSTATINVFPYATGTFNGITLIGVSSNSGTPCDQAVWGLGSYDAKYPETLSTDFVISTGSTTTVQIGAIVGDGLNTYVAWYDSASGGSYGIDAVSWTVKATGYVETLNMDVSSDFGGQIGKVQAEYQSLPASTSISFQYYKNNGNITSYINSAVNDAVNNLYNQETTVEARNIRFRMTLNPSSNNAPIVEKLNIYPV